MYNVHLTLKCCTVPPGIPQCAWN